MLVALPFAVLSVDGSTGAVALVAAAQSLPFLVLSLAGGVIADRGDRRRLMIASDLVRAVVQVAAAVLLLSGAAHPSLAGLMIVADPAVPFVFDAITFTASVAVLARLRPREAALVAAVDSDDAPPDRGFVAQLRGGWRAVVSRAWVRAFLVALVVYHVAVLPSVYVLGPVLADRELGGAGAWAVISTAFGLGALAGDLLLLRWRPRHALRVATIAMAVASCQAVIFGSGLPLALIAALEFLSAAGVTAMFSLWETSLAEHVPTAELSRVSSYDYTVSAGLIPLGVLVAAPVSGLLGLHTTLALMSAIGVLAAGLLLLVPAIRTLPRGGLGTA